MTESHVYLWIPILVFANKHAQKTAIKSTFNTIVCPHKCARSEFFSPVHNTSLTLTVYPQGDPACLLLPVCTEMCCNRKDKWMEILKLSSVSIDMATFSSHGEFSDATCHKHWHAYGTVLWGKMILTLYSVKTMILLRNIALVAQILVSETFVKKVLMLSSKSINLLLLLLFLMLAWPKCFVQLKFSKCNPEISINRDPPNKS